MTTFWTLAVAMTVVALAFTIPPLFRSSREHQVDRNQLNTEVIKDQLEELRADLETGKLEKEAYQAARLDLERELLNDLDENVTAAERAPRSGRWLAGVLLIFIPGMAYLTYQLLGVPRIIPALANTQPPVTQTQQASSGAEQQEHSMEEMVARLAERMRQQPDNVEGWVLLARSYTSMKRYAEAADAYGRAYRLRNDNAGLITDYADTLITANGGQFTDQVGVLLDEALALQPANVKALWLQGHWKYRHGDYQGALGNWQRVANLLPPGDENIAAIRQQIEQAKSRLAEQGVVVAAGADEATADAPQAPAADADSQIRVTVSLDPALSEKTTAEDTVFIFARAAQGPKMPLAIVRKQVKDLPVTVTLDDSLAMTPAMVMSKFPQVTVGARISKSGQAMPQSGDLQGTVTPVSTSGDASIELNIDSAIP
jgi:cytochrome c-type biogenesis protein CcmH